MPELRLRGTARALHCFDIGRSIDLVQAASSPGPSHRTSSRPKGRALEGALTNPPLRALWEHRAEPIREFQLAGRPPLGPPARLPRGPDAAAQRARAPGPDPGRQRPPARGHRHAPTLGDDDLARPFRVSAERLHFQDWSRPIQRKPGVLGNVREGLAALAGRRRSELLEWIISVLIVLYSTPFR